MRRTPTESDPGGSRLVVVGSGSLARAVCWSLATVATAPLAVTVLARSAAAAAELAWIGRTRAALTGRPLTVTADPAADLSPAGLADAIGRLAPAAVLVCASTQSPWERTTRPSGWTELVARAGFGATLPLQAALAADVARAVAAAAPDALLFNACFPDAVNPLLAALGLPVHSGVGNAAIVAASVQSALGLPDQDQLAVLAHHVHLHEPADPADEARAWRSGEPVAGVGGLLAAQRAADPREVNQVTGMATALLLGRLLAGAEVRTSLPGPLGLPGGYPVLLRGRELELRLPAGLDRAAAVAWNQRMADLDGVRVEDGRVLPAPAAAEALGPYLPDVASGFDARETPAVAAALLDLRSRLRAAPPSRGPRRNGAPPMSETPLSATAPGVRATGTANLILDWYDKLPAVIGRLVQDPAPVKDPDAFSPGFLLPDLDDDLRRFFAVAGAGWQPLPDTAGRATALLDLTRNPGTGTTKTFASLLIVARAVEYVRRTGERVLIFTPTSANKGTALRDAVLRAVEAGVVAPDQLRVAVLAPRSCQAKQRASRLSADEELRRLNPLLRYDGDRSEDVKALGREFVTRYAAQAHDREGLNVWFSLELRNYLIADAARAFFEHQVAPTAGAAPRLHAHAVSSAYGLLGYNLGRDVLEAAGEADPADRPGFLLVQHLGTPDMVLHLRTGGFDRAGVPAFARSGGLFTQDADPRFPARTYDPAEVLDPTFYTHRPPTATAMTDLIGRHGGDGIVVSLAECLERYPRLREQVGDLLPADPRRLQEWSLAMALTGTANAVERGLVAPGTELVVHASGSYGADDYRPVEDAALRPVGTVEDVAAAVLGAS